MVVKITEQNKHEYLKKFEAISKVVKEIDPEAKEAQVNNLTTYYRALDYIIKNGTDG